MGMVVNTNIMSLNAQRSLSRNTAALGKSVERLSTGLRINRAADDAAGPEADHWRSTAGVKM